MSIETEPKPPPDVSRLRIQRGTGAEHPPRRKGPIVIGVLAGMAVLFSFGYWRYAGSFRPLEVSTALVAGPDVSGGGSSILTASGYVVARRKAGVGPKFAGLLEYLGVEEGSKVQKGQVIGRLQHKDVDAQLTAQRSELEQARADLGEAEAARDQYQKEFDRARSLLAQGVVSQADFDVAEFRLRAQFARVRSQKAAITTAQARVLTAEVAVQDTEVRAPFTGTVLTKDAEEGETVAPAAAGRASSRGSIVTMADLASLEVEVDVNESYIARLAQAQPCRIVADPFPGTVFNGLVRQVIPTADRQKATVQVKVSILDPSELLRPEMGAKVTFMGSTAATAAPTHPLPRVSTRAIVTGTDGIKRVWIVDGETAKLVRVETAGETEGMTEIRAGLSGGERVVTDPPSDLAGGKKIRVRP